MAHKIELSEQDYKKVQEYAGLGLTVSLIAHSIDMNKRTFERRMLEDERLSVAIERGRADTAVKVTRVAMDMILDGNVPMTIFWLKTRLGWREKDETPQAVIMPDLVATVDNIADLVRAAKKAI